MNKKGLFARACGRYAGWMGVAMVFLFSVPNAVAVEPAVWLQGSYPWRVSPQLRFIIEPEL
ncbi:MAG: hypothetical protein EBR29_07090, partial [Sphingobacteriia bacterium]|nr:hypothetical protein [Sphingobacteriia bacterium]